MDNQKPFPALCLDCKWSKPEPRFEWNNRCFHPKVIARDPWALSNNYEGQPVGVSCRDERQKRSLFAPCGMSGRLWERKADALAAAEKADPPQEGA